MYLDLASVVLGLVLGVVLTLAIEGTVLILLMTKNIPKKGGGVTK